MLSKIFDYWIIILTIIYFSIWKILSWNEILENLLSNNIAWNVILILNFSLLVLSGYSIISLIQTYSEKFWYKLVSQTDSRIDNIILFIFLKFLRISKYVISIYIWYYLLDLPKGIDLLLWEFFNVSFILIWIILINTFINKIFKSYLIRFSENNALSKQLIPFLNKVVVVSIWIFGIILIISNLGYDVTALIAWAWIWGLAFALAAQKSIANIFWAITIILNKPFKVWDFINISGFDWTVKDIWITYLTLIDKSGHEIYIPNESIISNAVQNYSQRESRRADFSIWVVYSTTLEKVKEGVEIIEAILQNEIDNWKLKSFRVNFDTFGDFSLNINVNYFSNELDFTPFLKEKERINIEIKKQFSNAGLEMAFPTRELIIKK